MEFDVSNILEQQGEAMPAAPTQDEYAEQKRIEKQMCQQMRALALTHAYSGKGALLQYLDMQARLSNMSAGNTLLILSQNPQASDVRTFEAWRTLNRSVKTGETGLLILEPQPYETQDNGKFVQRTGYNVRRRFDVSQTHGEPLTPERGIPFDPVQRLRVLVQNPPVRLVSGEDAQPVAARYDAQERVIFVAKGYDAEDTFRAMIVSIAEASVRQGARNEATPFVAQCAAYIACKRIGMENLRDDAAMPLDIASAPRDCRMEALTDAASLASALQARLSRQMEQRAQGVQR